MASARPSSRLTLPTRGGNALLGESQHVGTNVHPNDPTTRTHDNGSSLGYSASTGAEVEDALACGQVGAGDHSVDNRCKALVDLVQVDVRDAIPNADLPRKTFLLQVGPAHTLSLLGCLTKCA